MNPLRLKSLVFGNDALTPKWPDLDPTKFGAKMPEGKRQSNRPALTDPHFPFEQSDFARLFGQMMAIGGQVEITLFWLDGRSHSRWGAQESDPGEETEASRNVGIRYRSTSALCHPDQ